ncbi:peptidyl-prolyl isomerase CWC27 [Polyplosphaeria fusca]|uniref:Peptidyl-prolyl isomerase CWC27 n=1 Tax=Polyplosphaeria fusca TaxID=682080 RepID=A0A9P4R908_9PLEO|nr:peptidyl-prolyl isomerase CWC27 [Polyplosphaeria fusca]
MSNTYNVEPNPTAKVILQTSSGDIELELFAKQTPKTSRNFLQLCLDGYYDNTIFHRLVKGFIVQGGDPSGTGQGGESSYDGEPFTDEFNPRLRFNRRGLLGMANTGVKDDNGSQFFMTLGNTPELTGKNTMFGRVVGDTIYNLMKMGDAETAEDDEERPLYPTRVTGVDIIINPFDDMVKRVKVADHAEAGDRKTKRPKRKAGKALLSFGGDEGDDAASAPLPKKAKFNTKLVSAETKAPPAIDSARIAETGSAERSIPIRKPSRKSPPRSPPPDIVPKARRETPPRKKSPVREASPKVPEQSRLERVNAQIEEVMASMKRGAATQSTAPTKKKSMLEDMIPSTSMRGRKRGAGATNAASEKAALDLLAKFKSKLEAAPAPEAAKIRSPERPEGIDGQNGGDDATRPSHAEGDGEPCDLHFIIGCQSCTAWDKQEEEDSDDDTGWMSHALSFAKDRLGKDLEWKRKNEEELVVIDPLAKAKDLKEERRAKKDRW